MKILFDGDIIIKDNFLSNDEIKLFNFWFNSFNYNNLKSYDDAFWHKRLIRRDQTTQQDGYADSFNEVNGSIDKIRNRVIDALNSFENEKWILSEFNFIKMWNGSNPFPNRRNKELEMFYHRDNQESNGYANEVFWGAVIYTNDNYLGGELSYPKYKFKHKPKEGSIVFHRGNVKHGVLNVENGIRYSIAATITKE